nr:MAG TPA: hypothetical protein [Caudoviricetes sp.]
MHWPKRSRSGKPGSITTWERSSRSTRHARS